MKSCPVVIHGFSPYSVLSFGVDMVCDNDDIWYPYQFPPKAGTPGVHLHEQTSDLETPVWEEETLPGVCPNSAWPFWPGGLIDKFCNPGEVLSPRPG